MLRMPHRAAYVARLTLVIGAACAEAPSSDVAVRDSAGIRIVENHAPDAAWGGSPGWRAVPVLTIGADSAEAYRFGQVGDVAATAAGDIIVLDQAAAQLRVFGPDGAFRRTIGREGRGPGELSRFANTILVAPGDSLLVPDPRERRITVFAPNGAFARVIAATQLPMGKGWLRLDDGRILQRGYATSRAPDGSFAFWDAMLRVAADGASAETLFVFDHTKTPLGAPGAIRIALIVNSPSWARLDDGRIAWSALDRDFVAIHDSTGRLVGRFSRAQWKARPLRDADRETLRELLRVKLRALGGSPGLADSPMVEAPPLLPAITTVRAGPRGTLWVQRMGDVALADPMALNASERADFFGGPAWDVLDGEGRYLGTLALPPRFRVFRITDAAILGAVRDDDGVERVVRLALRR